MQYCKSILDIEINSSVSLGVFFSKTTILLIVIKRCESVDMDYLSRLSLTSYCKKNKEHLKYKNDTEKTITKLILYFVTITIVINE